MGQQKEELYKMVVGILLEFDCFELAFICNDNCYSESGCFCFIPEVKDKQMKLNDLCMFLKLDLYLTICFYPGDLICQPHR